MILAREVFTDTGRPEQGVKARCVDHHIEPVEKRGSLRPDIET
jgi:hypothetical protein